MRIIYCIPEKQQKHNTHYTLKIVIFYIFCCDYSSLGFFFSMSVFMNNTLSRHFYVFPYPMFDFLCLFISVLIWNPTLQIWRYSFCLNIILFSKIILEIWYYYWFSPLFHFRFWFVIQFATHTKVFHMISCRDCTHHALSLRFFRFVWFVVGVGEICFAVEYSLLFFLFVCLVSACHYSTLIWFLIVCLRFCHKQKQVHASFGQYFYVFW